MIFFLLFQGLKIIWLNFRQKTSHQKNKSQPGLSKSSNVTKYQRRNAISKSNFNFELKDKNGSTHKHGEIKLTPLSLNGTSTRLN